MRRYSFLKKLTIVAVAAGIIYNWWPLGYWLNPVVGRRGLASELEGLHQPYNWLFILGDCVSSVLIIVVAYALWRNIKGHKDRTLFKVSLLSVAAFGIGTIVDALLPLHCDPSIQQCLTFMHDPLLLAHGIFSIGASIALFISLFAIWLLDRRSRVMNTVMIGYVIFGLISLYNLFTPNDSPWAQHYYITLCSVWLALLPYAILRTNRRTNSDLKVRQVKNLSGVQS